MEAAQDQRSQPATDTRHASARLIEALDKRSLPNGVGASDSESLLTALDAYLKDREDREREILEADSRLERKDLFWLWSFVIAVLVLGTLVPDSFFEKLRYKEYGEKIFTYVIGAGIFSKWLRSPKDLRNASRATSFHVAVALLLLVGVVLAVNIFKVRPLKDSEDLEVYLDGSKEKLEKREFAMRLKGLEVRLVRPKTRTEDARERFIDYSLMDLLHEAQLTRSGLLVRPKLRMDYDLLLECSEGFCAPPATVTFTMEGAAFDDEYRRYLGDQELTFRDGPSSVDFPVKEIRTTQIKLLPGKYQVVVQKATDKGVCKEDPKPKTVGGSAEPKFFIEMTRCNQ